MMMCETRQMSSNPEGLAQLEVMVKRYRNSPCVILWSIGNEEGHLQNDMAEEGAKIAATMVERCHELDPTRVVSAAVNGDNAEGRLGGLRHHWLQLQPEVSRRLPQDPSNPAHLWLGDGERDLDARRVHYRSASQHGQRLRREPHQLGRDLAEEWWTFYGTREWEAGGFAWTGFDYRGEPTPYGWPSINSQFGIMDMCGFPKDTFYYYKAWWGKEPVLHLFPHWNFEGREGDEIPVWVHSNLDSVELFVNGKSQGIKARSRIWATWSGRCATSRASIEARGTKDGKVVLTEKRETTGPAVAIRLTADRTEIDADGEDLAILKVEALDKDGRPVPTAQNCDRT